MSQTPAKGGEGGVGKRKRGREEEWGGQKKGKGRRRWQRAGGKYASWA